MVVDSGPTMVDSNIKSFLPPPVNEKCGKKIMSLVIDADDLLKIREKVCELYVDKKVIIAPCLSKLYISRAQQVIDCEGKTTPDWFYFGTGIIALIYDTNSKGFKIVLFEERSCRLLWCMNWADYVKVQSQTSNFHILNTKPDFSQHVGFLYENRDVADLILNAINLISTTDSKQQDDLSCTQCEDRRGKTRLLRSISMNNKKGNNKTTRQVENNAEIPDHLRFFKRRSSLRDSLLRKTINRKYENSLTDEKCEQKERSSTVIGAFSKDVSNENNNTCTDDVASVDQALNDGATQNKLVHRKLTSLSRANSFRKAVNNIGCEDTDKTRNLINVESDPNSDISKQETKPNGLENKLSRDNTACTRENIVKNLFRKRRISRSQSLKTINRKRDSQISQSSQCSQLSQTSQNDDNTKDQKEVEVVLDSKYYQRTKKLVKTRSSTDSLLLRGEAMQNIIETGHVARYARQRKQWSKRLETTEMPSTDLCVTEL